MERKGVRERAVMREGRNAKQQASVFGARHREGGEATRLFLCVAHQCNKNTSWNHSMLLNYSYIDKVQCLQSVQFLRDCLEA